MNTMKWLLRREFWEHKGSMFWAPLIVGSLIVLLISSVMIYGAVMGEFEGQLKVHGKTEQLTAMFNSLPLEKRQHIGDAAAMAYMGAAVPLLLMMSIIAFFYCLGALHDERRDRSILFWKSLPVSDTETVLSKVVTAAVVTPLIALGVGIGVSLVLFMIVGTMAALHGVNLFGLVLSNANFYLVPLRLLGLLPVYILWALPTIGWLMLVSAWAKSKVFLWAVGVPVITIVVFKWIEHLMNLSFNFNWFFEHVISRALVGLIPGVWLPLTSGHKPWEVNAASTGVLADVFTQSWLTLATPQALIGALVGAAMIYAAIRMRRWKDEG